MYTCAVSVYQNDLFTDAGDVLGGPGSGGPSAQSSSALSARPGSARMQQQKTGLAARRQERMQASVYERNENMNRNPTSPTGQAGSVSRLAQASEPEHPGSPTGDVYGMRSSYDPNEENGVTRTFVSPRHQQGMQREMLQQHNQSMQREMQTVPVPRQLDLSDLKGFLGQPGPKGGPVLCYIVRDATSTKMYPKVCVLVHQFALLCMH